MSFFLKLVYINDIVIPIVAILCNILLLLLIKTVKTKTLIHINYSLVPHCILDIVASIATFVVAPHVFQIEGNLCIVFGDLFGSLFPFDKHMIGYITSFYSAILVISMMSITISFYIRYLVICRYQNISVQTMIFPYCLLFALFIFSYLLFLWFYLISNDFTKLTEISLLKIFWKDEYGRDPIFVANKVSSVPFFCICGFMLTIFGVAYGLIFFYSHRISKYLKTHTEICYNSSAKLLHKQIQRTLLIQAIGPFSIGSIPVLLIILKSLLVIRSNEFSLILSLFFAWVSIANPIAALMNIKPYKDHLGKIFKFALKPFKRNAKTSKIISVKILNDSNKLNGV